MSFDFKTAISSIAPTIATMLGGPLAGTAVTALESALGLTPGAGADGVTAAVAAGMTPEQISAVRAADQTHAERLKQMDIDVLKMNTDFQAAMVTADNTDRASARDREAKVGDKTARNLAYFVIVGGSSTIAVTLMGWAKADSVLAGTLIGYVVSEMKSVLQYYFGSSAGSQVKDTTIAAQAKAAAQ